MTLATTDVGGITLAGSRCRWHEPCNTTCGWHNPCYAYAHVYSPRARVTRAVAHAHVTTWAPRNCPDVAPGRPRTRPDGSRATRVACGLMARCSASHEQHTRACLHAHVPRWIFFPRNWCGAHPAPSVALPVFAHLREPLGWHAACTCPLHEPLPLLHQALRRTPRQTHACAPMGRRCHLLAHCEGGCAHSGTPEARGVGSLHRVIPESVGGAKAPYQQVRCQRKSALQDLCHERPVCNMHAYHFCLHGMVRAGTTLAFKKNSRRTPGPAALPAGLYKGNSGAAFGPSLGR